MKPEQPAIPEELLECLTSWTLGIFEVGKIIFGLDETIIVLQTTLCEANRKAAIMTTRTDDYTLSFWRQTQ